jgi:hypothetical protein
MQGMGRRTPTPQSFESKVELTMARRRNQNDTSYKGPHIDYVDPMSGVGVQYTDKGGRRDSGASSEQVEQWKRHNAAEVAKQQQIEARAQSHAQGPRNLVRATGTDKRGQTIFETFADNGPESRKQLQADLRARKTQEPARAIIPDSTSHAPRDDKDGARHAARAPVQTAYVAPARSRPAHGLVPDSTSQAPSHDHKDTRPSARAPAQAAYVAPARSRAAHGHVPASTSQAPHYDDKDRAPKNRTPHRQHAAPVVHEETPRQRRQPAGLQPSGTHRGFPLYDLRQNKDVDGTRDHATYRGQEVRVVTDMVRVNSQAQYNAMREQKRDQLQGQGFTLTTNGNYYKNPNRHKMHP